MRKAKRGMCVGVACNTMKEKKDEWRIYKGMERIL